VAAAQESAEVPAPQPMHSLQGFVLSLPGILQLVLVVFKTSASAEMDLSQDLCPLLVVP
jgi:hypothetical protein